MRTISLALAVLFAMCSMLPLFLANGQPRWVYPSPPPTTTRELAISSGQEIERLRQEVDDLKHQLGGDGRESLGSIVLRISTLEAIVQSESTARKEQWATEQKVFFGIAGAIALAMFERLLPRLRRRKEEDE